MSQYQNIIMGISGGQGTGKTTVDTALGKIAFNQGLKLYSTYHIDYSKQEGVKDYEPIGSLDDIKYMRGGPHGAVWLADELYQWLFSRSSQSDINKQISMILMVARKRGISIFYTCHHPMHIDVMLRRVTNKWAFPHIYPIHQLDMDKVNAYAEQFGVSETVALRYFRRKLKSDPTKWMIRCGIYDADGRHTGTFNLRNLPYWFSCFDTREEVNPLDMKGKREYISERGMELEMSFVNYMTKLGWVVYRVPHSGRYVDTHCDHFMWHPGLPGTVFFVNVCGIRVSRGQYRLLKSGAAIKSVLDESKGSCVYKKVDPGVVDHVKRSGRRIALIGFYPYMGEWWYVVPHDDDYYVKLKGEVSLSYDFKDLIKPLSGINCEYGIEKG